MQTDKRRVGVQDVDPVVDDNNSMGLVEALHEAAAHGNAATVRALLEQGANVDAVGEGGETALHRAAVEGQVEVLRLLLQAGADSNAVDEAGRTALLAASLAGQMDVVLALAAGNEAVQGTLQDVPGAEDDAVDLIKALLSSASKPQEVLPEDVYPGIDPALSDPPAATFRPATRPITSFRWDEPASLISRASAGHASASNQSWSAWTGAPPMAYAPYGGPASSSGASSSYYAAAGAALGAAPAAAAAPTRASLPHTASLAGASPFGSTTPARSALPPGAARASASQPRPLGLPSPRARQGGYGSTDTYGGLNIYSVGSPIVFHDITLGLSDAPSGSAGPAASSAAPTAAAPPSSQLPQPFMPPASTTMPSDRLPYESPFEHSVLGSSGRLPSEPPLGRSGRLPSEPPFGSSRPFEYQDLYGAAGTLPFEGGYGASGWAASSSTSSGVSAADQSLYGPRPMTGGFSGAVAQSIQHAGAMLPQGSAGSEAELVQGSPERWAGSVPDEPDSPVGAGPSGRVRLQESPAPTAGDQKQGAFHGDLWARINPFKGSAKTAAPPRPALQSYDVDGAGVYGHPVHTPQETTAVDSYCPPRQKILQRVISTMCCTAQDMIHSGNPGIASPDTAAEGGNLRHLQDAARRGDVKRLKSLLASVSPSAVNDSGSDGRTPLLLAASHGHVEVVQLLLDAGAHLWPRSMDGTDALGCAAQEGHAAVVEALLLKKADKNNRNLAGHTPLMLAVSGGHVDAVELLVGHGADATAKDIAGSNILHLAISLKDKETRVLMVQRLLSRCSSGDLHQLTTQQDKYRLTPLTAAALNEDTEVVQLLLSHNGASSMQPQATSDAKDKQASADDGAKTATLKAGPSDQSTSDALNKEDGCQAKTTGSTVASSPASSNPAETNTGGGCSANASATSAHSKSRPREIVQEDGDQFKTSVADASIQSKSIDIAMLQVRPAPQAESQSPTPGAVQKPPLLGSRSPAEQGAISPAQPKPPPKGLLPRLAAQAGKAANHKQGKQWAAIIMTLGKATADPFSIVEVLYLVVRAICDMRGDFGQLQAQVKSIQQKAQQVQVAATIIISKIAHRPPQPWYEQLRACLEQLVEALVVVKLKLEEYGVPMEDKKKVLGTWTVIKVAFNAFEYATELRNLYQDVADRITNLNLMITALRF